MVIRMIPQSSPGTSGAIQARLQYLRNRKLELDKIIASLERYEAMHMASDVSRETARHSSPDSGRTLVRKPARASLEARSRRLAGAA